MPEEATQDRIIPTPRKRNFVFLVQFLLLVTIFLVGYRFVINTGPNIRYLYMIASQTSAVINILGFDGEVEPSRQHYTRSRVRTEFNELRVRDRMSRIDEDDTLPPSSWEYWRLIAHRSIQNGPGLIDNGPTVRLDAGGHEFRFRVVPDCGAIPSLSIYLAAVLAFPVAWRKCFIGAIAGLATLYGINIIRLVVLAFVGAYDSTPDQKIFTFIHEYVWQSIFLLFVVCVWIAWIELIVKPKDEAST